MKSSFTAVLLTLILSAATLSAMPLSSLTAVGQSRQVLVRWELTDPQTIVRFDIVRNGRAAARVPVTPAQRHYEWLDQEVQNDHSYAYALIAVHADGTREEWGIVQATPAFDAAVVREFKLHQNFPNPFNPETTIEVEIAEDGPAELVVFDVLGQQVATPLNGNLTRGRYSVLFDGRDLPSGVYFYQLSAGSFVDQKKMVLLK
ncbi:MAG: T9SS type A sorting domain-containing protein [bacterium]|nr:T9SS type A sorting domain-containing protein [bacterium]MBK8130783.1 T9SS type A sorting domain-containing protein [bacterium]